MPEPECQKRDASGKNGELPCRRFIFDQIKANLAEIQPEKCQNVQKTRFLQKAPGVNGLKKKEAILLTEGHGVRVKGVGVNARLVS